MNHTIFDERQTGLLSLIIEEDSLQRHSNKNKTTNNVSSTGEDVKDDLQNP